MKRKNVIIISITGITLILLCLLGFTYGYFLSVINGNTNNKSVDATTAIKGIEITDLISEDISDIIEPGYVNIKLFTVENTGNTKANYNIYLTDVVNTFERTEDVEFTLYRKDGNATIDTSDLSDCTIISSGSLPTKNSYITTNEIINNNGDYYTYALKVTYKNLTDVNQDVDQGKTFSYKVIIDSEKVNPFTTNTLAFTIMNSAFIGGKRTIYQETPITTPGQSINTETESTLSKTQDDDGDSYYFRGNVVDNYVNYANMCWRIVRIEGDGSIKLILASEKTCSTSNLTTSSGYATNGSGTILTANYGYKNVVVGSKTYKINDYINSAADTTGNARTKLNDWLARKITSSSDLALLKEETWCIGDQTNGYSSDDTGEIVGTISNLINSGTSFYFTAGNKYSVTKTPSLKCETTGVDGETDTNTVGMLTFDEIAFAGGSNKTNSNYYLNNNATTNYWWALSPSIFIVNYSYVNAFFVDSVGGVSNYFVNSSYALRPSISLKPNVQITGGNGTKDNPYEVKLS